MANARRLVAVASASAVAVLLLTPGIAAAATPAAQPQEQSICITPEIPPINFTGPEICIPVLV